MNSHHVNNQGGPEDPRQYYARPTCSSYSCQLGVLVEIYMPCLDEEGTLQRSVEGPADADTFEGGQGHRVFVCDGMKRFKKRRRRQEKETREKEGRENATGLLEDVSKVGHRKIPGHAMFV